MTTPQLLTSSERLIEYLTKEEVEQLEAITHELRYRWDAYARPKQLPPPGNWGVWLVLAGRGFGKTRVGAEWVRDQQRAGRMRFALVAKKASEARDVMVEGESGILSCYPPEKRPRYEPSKRRLTWPNGAIATTYSAEEPDELRGPQHDAAWCDEIAKWKYPDETWSNLMMGLRLGQDPRCVATTTPQPIALIRSLVKDPTVHVTRGTTYENWDNLAPTFRTFIGRYEGTRLGRQELDAELLDDIEGALWNYAMIDACRTDKAPVELKRVVVAIDPATTAGEDSDETGIIVAGTAMCDCKGGKEKEEHGFVLDDLSLRASPDGWAQRAVRVYRSRMADRIIAEVNNGGDMVERTIRTVDDKVSYKAVHASRGKQTRAEPVAALYEQGKVHHVGPFPVLEDQLCNWVPGVSPSSPDHLDALVWAITELMVDERIMSWA